MAVFAYLSLAGAAILFSLAHIIYVQGRGNAANRIFALLCLSSSWWAFAEFMYRQADTYDEAYIWLKVNSLWPLTMALLLHAAILFTNRAGLLRNRLMYIPIYGGALVFMVVDLVSAVEPVRVSWGFTYETRLSPWFYGASAWSALLAFSALVLTMHYYFRAEDRGTKARSRYISLAFAIPIVSGTLTEVLLPALEIVVPETTALSLTLVGGILAYAYWRHGLFVVSPQTAADRIMATMSDSLLLLDREGNINMSNPAASTLLGYPPGALVGKPAGAIFMNGNLIDGPVYTLLMGQAIKDHDVILKNKDGKAIPALLSAAPLRDKRKNLTGIVIVARDITERKRAEKALQQARDDLERRVQQRTAELTGANEILRVEIAERVQVEEALRRSEERYRAVVENSPAAILLVDSSYRFVYVNEEASRVIGYSISELAGQDFRGFLDEADLQLVADRYLRRRRGEQLPSQYEFDIVRKCGEKRRVEISAALIRDSSGEMYTLAQILDVTERKRAEEELRQAMADLQRSNAELQQFAHIASHDLQEPLRMIASYMQLLERRYRGKLSAEADEFIAYAVDGAARMQRLIHDLLLYSRVGVRGRGFETTDCEVVIQQALANLRMALEESRASVVYGPLPTIVADPVQLVQLFQNLIGNAIKFRSAEPPRIQVSAERKGEEWVFSVADNGIGIDPQYAERIFGIFQRLHSREEYPGTGIGLAICKKVVERHGGRIWVDSVRERGSTFYFTIPVKGGDQS